MTVSELGKLVGRVGLLGSGAPGLRFGVTIVDARMNYGRVEVQVQPIAGEGETWVSRERVEVQG